MILDSILEQRAVQLEHEKRVCPFDEMRQRAAVQLEKRKPLSLKKALKRDTLSCICEVKKASPSKGLICADFHPVETAIAYESAGANAISCLTEEHYFQGSSTYLSAIREKVQIPILRKDFLTEPYQIYEAAALGADAVLLIAAILDFAQMQELYTLTDSLGMEALVEVHNEQEIEKISPLHPEILGVNNRDLKTFTVDLSTVSKMKPFAPADAVFVSESGIRTNEDMRAVRKSGADAVLIGETLMRSDDIAASLARLRSGV